MRAPDAAATLEAMETRDAAAYGDAIADIYDELHADVGASDAVALLAELAGAGPALELGVGTGRLALPLAARGVEVHGIDVSSKMLERLRSRPGGDRVQTTLGDFADVGVDGSYRLIYVCFNTFFGLVTVDAQERCMKRVARHLARGGRFVVEAFVPAAGAPRRQSRTDIFFHRGTVRLCPVDLRTATVAELDLLACIGGLRLERRYGSWRRTPFGRHSGSHISIYAPSG